MSINTIIEALNTPATQQSYVDLVGLILRERQINTANANVQYNWLGNALTDVSRIMISDGVRVLGINGIESSSNFANSLIKSPGSDFYDTGVLESFNTMPGNVGANVFVINSYNVLIPEKDFAFANAAANTNITNQSYLNTYTNSLLSNSNVYANLSIRTGLDYALSNNYLQAYSFTANSLISEQDVETIEAALELVLGDTKSTTLSVLGGGL